MFEAITRVSPPVRAAVIGAGYFGSFHAKHLAAHPDVQLAYIVDVDEAKARALSDQYGATASTDYTAVLGELDTAHIAVPTAQHFDVARDCIEAGVDVLIEKPITDSVESAYKLVDLAEERGRVLMVGHLERFSTTFRALAQKTRQPLYIESYRIAPWKGRAGDVDVVLDLMIHDIDLILGLVPSPVARVDAIGARIINPSPDLANARIVFESGSVANVTASRVSYKTERRLRVFESKSYVRGDFDSKKVDNYTIQGDPETDGLAAIKYDSVDVPDGDSLGNEIAEFVDCVITGREPSVTGRECAEAVRVAQMVLDSISEHHRGVQAQLDNEHPDSSATISDGQAK